MIVDIADLVFESKQITDSSIYFPNYVHNYLSKYIEFIHKSNFSLELTKRISTFRDKIYFCLIENYSGQMNSSYKYFCEALDSICFSSSFVSLKENVFYRIRSSKTDENGKQILHTNKEMFHIPFENRYRVSTQRYSYPGLPCLYLGNSIDVCLFERGSTNDDYINVARIELNNNITVKVVDLFFFENYNFKDLSEEQMIRFLLLWPLVMCCSFSYKDDNKMYFRPDYIIPQMLLEYLIDCKYSEMLNGKEEIVAGIRYHSVQRPMFPLQKEKQYVNYVFPVQESRVKGFCEKLKNEFHIQEVAFLKDMRAF